MEITLMNVMCSRCKKRVAVIFLTRLENGQSINEGLCLQCAKEMGIGPINELIDKMGLTDDPVSYTHLIASVQETWAFPRKRSTSG